MAAATTFHQQKKALPMQRLVVQVLAPSWQALQIVWMKISSKVKSQKRKWFSALSWYYNTHAPKHIHAHAFHAHTRHANTHAHIHTWTHPHPPPHTSLPPFLHTHIHTHTTNYHCRLSFDSTNPDQNLLKLVLPIPSKYLSASQLNIHLFIHLLFFLFFLSFDFFHVVISNK